MSWFIKRSPFGRDEDPLDHMVELLSAEAIKDGVPLTERDREILANAEPMPEILRQRAKDLIKQIFEANPSMIRKETQSASVAHWNARWHGQTIPSIRISWSPKPHLLFSSQSHMRTITDFPTPIGENQDDLFARVEVSPSQDGAKLPPSAKFFFDSSSDPEGRMPQASPELDFPDG
jgi:hypothetical protein